MRLGLRFREMFVGFLWPVGEELEQIVSVIKATWLIEHDVDGHHTNLTGNGSGLTGLSTVPIEVPAGCIMAYGGSTAPTGYFLCDGSAQNRTTYAKLYSIIGTTYGAGDGSTTFNVPDLRQRFPLGKATAGTGVTLGGSGGTIDHTHTGPSHTHTGPSHTHTGPDHTHQYGSISTDAEALHTHAVDPPNTTSTVTSNNHESTPGGVTSIPSDPHTHDVDIAAFTSGVGSSHSHTIAAQTTGSSGTGNTGAAGTGATGAEGTGVTSTANPPFLSVQYIIRAI